MIPRYQGGLLPSSGILGPLTGLTQTQLNKYCEAAEERSSRELLTPNHLLVGVGGPTAFSIRRQGFIFNFYLAKL